MSELQNHEIWQAKVGGQVYEADLAELATWVADGGLQPEDKVRRGNLRWIEARKVPMLIPHFNAKRDGATPPQIVVTVTDAAQPVVNASPSLQPAAPPRSIAETKHRDPNYCTNHLGEPSKFICSECQTAYCKACPSSYGGNVKICPACGGLCSDRTEAIQKNVKDVKLDNLLLCGFGAADLSAALGYPFRFKVSLVVGTAIYVFFTLGCGAGALGGIFGVVGALFSAMLANMLTFGILAHTADEFSRGRTDSGFMPPFEDFSMWDDVLHPFFLSIGTYLSAFGPFFIVAGIGAYLVFSSLSTQQNATMSQIEKLPGTPYYSATNTLKQTEEFNKVLGDVKRQNDERLAEQADVANGTTRETKAIELDHPNSGLVEKVQKDQLESALGKTAETKANEQSQFIARFLSVSAPLVVFSVIALLWGLFYFPAACAVAGYTRSFVSTINPFVGLDTIKRLGADYVKLLVMSAALLILAVMVTWIAGLILAPFDIPMFGNLPAVVIGSIVNFFLWIVFCTLLGFLLLKASDKLKLPR